MKQYKELEQVVGFQHYLASSNGKIYKKVANGLREVAINMDRYGFLRVNLQQDEPNTRPTTKRVHMLVYEAYKGKPEGELIFLDGNRENCKLENLVSMGELLDCYKQHNQ